MLKWSAIISIYKSGEDRKFVGGLLSYDKIKSDSYKNIA